MPTKDFDLLIRTDRVFRHCLLRELVEAGALTPQAAARVARVSGHAVRALASDGDCTIGPALTAAYETLAVEIESAAAHPLHS